MRTVGNQHRGLNTTPLTPQEAWQRGRMLDAMLPNPRMTEHGILRLTHAQRNALDDAHMLTIARRLKALQAGHGAA
jgi:hypothetical protein